MLHIVILWGYNIKMYPPSLIQKARFLRSKGKTYKEIKQMLKLKVPKSTLSYWVKNVSLPEDYIKKVVKLNRINLNKARLIALKANKIKRQIFLFEINKRNTLIVNSIFKSETAKIALAMLCLAEAKKYTSKGSSFNLGNSDPRIIVIFLALLKKCFNFNPEKVRCTVQCRADQDIEELEKFWRNVTKVPEKLFYKAQIDPRTIGKPTKKKDYKGVLKVDYLDTKVQLELESLANLVYNQLQSKNGPEV